jgi:general secretion pathway protein K
LGDFFRGSGNFRNAGPGFFQNSTEASRISGPTGDAAAVGSTISALRITVKVREGRSEFRMSVVVAPPNGATTVQALATRPKIVAGASSTNPLTPNGPDSKLPSAPPAAAVAAGQKTAAARNLKYPFTLLEIRENDEIPVEPPAPPADSLF